MLEVAEQVQSGEKRPPFKIFNVVQDFYKLRDQCLAEGHLFEDPTFDTVDRNVFSKDPPQQLEWKRPTELTSDPHFFVEGSSRFDVMQGNLSDCWFLVAIANLTLNPTLFNRVVPEDQGFSSSKKYAGIFHFRFWQYGKWIDVVVDDRLPTNGKRLLFLKSNDQNEFWSALLEKAYAKLHGSYEALILGRVNEAMVDFTGGLTEEYSLRTSPPIHNLFTIMLKAHERKSFLGCSTSDNEDSTESTFPNGLVKLHAYSITDVKLLDIQTPCVPGQKQLLRIRNPWGDKQEWNGPWSDKSREWQCIHYEEKKKLGLVYADDGEFWISFSDFMENFDRVDICHLGPEAFEDDEHAHHKRWESKSFEGSWIKGVTAGGCSNYKDTFATNPQYRIQLEDPDDDDEDNTCTLIVSLMQKYRRAQKQIGIKDLSIGFIIYYLKNPESTPRPLTKEFFKSNRFVAAVDLFKYVRQVTKRFKLAPGTYCIIPSTFKPDVEADFLLRVYSEKKNVMSVYDDDVLVSEADANVVKEVLEDEDKRSEVNEAFRRFAGADLEVDANELKEVLKHVLREEFDFPGFGLNLCRGMIAMMDSDHSGKLGFEKFKKLWIDIAICNRVFKLYDKNNSGSFTSFELRSALISAGYRVNKNILKVLTLRYANKNNEVSFKNFIMCAIKLKTMIEAFKEKDTQGRNKAFFNMDEWLTLTMYS